MYGLRPRDRVDNTFITVVFTFWNSTGLLGEKAEVDQVFVAMNLPMCLHWGARNGQKLVVLACQQYGVLSSVCNACGVCVRLHTCAGRRGEFFFRFGRRLCGSWPKGRWAPPHPRGLRA